MPNYNAKPKKNPSSRSNRRRAIWLPLLCAAPVLAVLGWICLGIEPEPMTSYEILHKEKWAPKELARTMGHVFSPQSNRDRRDDVIQHLRLQLEKYGPEEQRNIRIEAMRSSVRAGLEQFRALPADRRAQMIEKMQRDADNNFQEAQRRSNRDLGMMAGTAEGVALNDEVSRILYAELSSDERREFSGLIRKWVQIMNVKR